MSLLVKAISSMEKCFMDESIASKPEVSRVTALRGEEASFEIAYTMDDAASTPKYTTTYQVDSPIAQYVTVRQVEQVPVRYPCYPSADDHYVRKTPGLYPDLLNPVDPWDEIFATYGQLKALWVSVDVPEDLEAGDYPVYVCFMRGGEEVARAGVTLHVIGAVLPKSNMVVTQWFHCDCIANYYGLETFSDRHWEYIEKFIDTAVKNGINAILMPIFTPPLDTAVGHERRTTQLVDVTKTEDGWKFGWEKVERWVEMCKRAGVDYYEIAHLYSQWGAIHAPKIMGWENGEYKRLFGWETDATSEEYRTFLRTFLTGFTAKMRELGVEDRQCLYHISDEPSLEQLESYRAAKEQVADLLKNYVIMDALSNFEFYKTGALDNPIPSNNHIEPFIEAKVPNLWTYYCCGQGYKVSNRFLAMPTQRTRVIGTQFWKYNIAGFLQWGYNFYNSQGSIRPIDPYLITDGEYFVPAGDCFSVYPGQNGVALETIHLKGFTMALNDTRAMYLAESIVGREKLMKILESEGEVTFSEYPHTDAWLNGVRDAVNAIIEEGC